MPSAGGHWAIQGPFVLQAALSLHASARTAMGVAMAGIRLQRVMGYTAVTFIVSLVIYAAALLLVP